MSTAYFQWSSLLDQTQKHAKNFAFRHLSEHKQGAHTDLSISCQLRRVPPTKLKTNLVEPPPPFYRTVPAEAEIVVLCVLCCVVP